MKNIAIACVVVMLVGFACGTPDQAHPPPAAAPINTIAVIDAAIPDAQFTFESAAVAVARFKNNQLINCTIGAVTVTSGVRNKSDTTTVLDATQLARLLMDDGKRAFDSPKSDTVLASSASDKPSMSKMLLALAVGAKQVDASMVSRDAELSKEVASIKQEIASVKQADSEVSMTNCNISDKTILGTCVIEDAFTAPTSAAITWRVARFHFDVSTTIDSDAGMLSCLRLGGKWTAAAKNDPAVLRERLHQHAAQLRELGSHTRQ